MEEKLDFFIALTLAVSEKYDMSARDAVGMVMTSKYAKHDFVPDSNYTQQQIGDIALTI